MSILDRVFAAPRRARKPPAPPTAAAARPYAMERMDNQTAEIVLYGDIVTQRPMNWWTGEPDDGQYIILSEFLEDLKQVEDVSHLTVRIHSVGGNAYDAMVIHNRMKSMAAEITVVVDGVAMSGGSLIMCAGDRVLVYPSSLVMIHECWSLLCGGYNASELRKMADSNDAVDRSQAAIYQAKTGLDTAELLAMMETETYMTGQEAIDKGFADEMAEGSGMELAASADRCTLFAGGRPVWVTTRKGGIPAAIPTVKPEAFAPVMAHTHTPVSTGRRNGGFTMANTLEELQAENPELANRLRAEAMADMSAAAAQALVKPPDTPSAQDGAAAERARIREIDALSPLYDEETIREAKYGDHPCTAQEMTYRAAQKAAGQGRAFLAGMAADAAASGAQQVGAAPADPDDGAEGDPRRLMAQGRADAKAWNKRNEEGL